MIPAKTPAVTLRTITAQTVRTIINLQVSPQQRHLVAPNAVSLAEALFHPEAWYRAVYADEDPVGFVMLYLLGFDLLTGVFMLTPLAWLDKRPGVTLPGILKHWGLVFAGNFAGAFTVAVLMATIFTNGFATEVNKVGAAISVIGEKLNAMSAKGPDGEARKPEFSIRFVRSFIRAATGTKTDFLEPGQLLPIFNALVGGFGQAIAQMTPAEDKPKEAPKGN